ncbi:rhomboid family intramembrane serine protease [Candidatus Gracilibacteria bacterium]|nr:rhomboid family intramembrane serine protease [Candidatus Gracilibacteria bacterium]
MFPFFPQRSLSHLLILISVVISMIGFAFPQFVSLYGMNGYYYMTGNYVSLIVQICLFQFLHGGIIHLLANSYFLYTAGPELEARMSRDRYTWFFISTTIVVAGALIISVPQSLTIGISGFCMAILSYLWIDLYTTRHPMAPQILAMLAINIGIGLVPGISLVGHLSGAIWGLVWWGIARNWRK